MGSSSASFSTSAFANSCMDFVTWFAVVNLSNVLHTCSNGTAFVDFPLKSVEHASSPWAMAAGLGGGPGGPEEDGSAAVLVLGSTLGGGAVGTSSCSCHCFGGAFGMLVLGRTCCGCAFGMLVLGSTCCGGALSILVLGSTCCDCALGFMYRNDSPPELISNSGG